MELWQAAILGLVQGVTEFLPISSSAHLILTSRMLGWGDQGIHFDMAANTGSLVAVVAVFRQELWAILRDWLRSLRPGSPVSAKGRLAWQLLVATVPVALAGPLAQGFVASQGRNAGLIATTTIGFAVLLGLADRRASGRGGSLEGMSLRQALFVGAAQALAVIPGTSRSGVTITAGLATGLSRFQAAHFSFLLAVPVGLLVGLKNLLDLTGALPVQGGPVPGGPVEAGWAALAVGFGVSTVSAFFAIRWLLDWVRARNMAGFVVYRLILGLYVVELAL